MCEPANGPTWHNPVAAHTPGMRKLHLNVVEGDEARGDDGVGVQLARGAFRDGERGRAAGTAKPRDAQLLHLIEQRRHLMRQIARLLLQRAAQSTAYTCGIYALRQGKGSAHQNTQCCATDTQQQLQGPLSVA